MEYNLNNKKMKRTSSKLESQENDTDLTINISEQKN